MESDGTNALRDSLGLQPIEVIKDESTEPIVDDKTETKDEIVDDNPLASLGKSEEPESKTEEPKSMWESYGYEDEDSFKSDFESLKGLKTSSEEWTLKEKEYQDKVAKLEENSKLYVTDDNLARLNILKNKESEDYDMYAEMVLGKSKDPFSVIASEMKRKHPNMEDEDIKYRIEKKYGINEIDRDMLDDDEISKLERENRIAKLDMEDDAKNIKDKLMAKFDEIELPSNREPDKLDVTKQKVDAKNAWTPYASNIVKDTGKFDFKIKVGDEDLQVDYSLSDKQTSEYQKRLLEAVYESGISGKNEAENKAVVEQLKATIISENLEGIIQSAVDKSNTYFSDYWDSKLKNPSQRGTRTITQTTDGKQDMGEAALRKQLNI